MTVLTVTAVVSTSTSRGQGVRIHYQRLSMVSSEMTCDLTVFGVCYSLGLSSYLFPHLPPPPPPAHPSYSHSPPWNTAKGGGGVGVSLAEDPELSRVPCFILGLSQKIALHALPASRNSGFVSPAFPIDSR